VSAPTSRLDDVRGHLAAATDCRCGDPACRYSTTDLRWAVEEIDYLRFYLAVLGDFAYALDAYRWALENPAPGRVEHHRRRLEEARRELLATPSWRPGECQGGCRRYATHEFVIELDGSVEREPCCEECGLLWLRLRRAAIATGCQPSSVLRLEPLARPRAEATGVRG
jgi:hypothetical protein